MKGIMFKPWKHKLIRENPDKEWQTRRVVKFKTENAHRVYKYVYPHPNGGFSFQDFPSPSGIADSIDKTGKMPRYRVGEVVYIKEAWSSYGVPPNEKPFYKDAEGIDIKAIGWHNPRTMPAWVARDFAKILGVKAERLQEITLEDVEAEGTRYWLEQHPEILDYSPFSARQCYSYLWDSINLKYPWSSNPWVWVYTLKLVKSIERRGNEMS